MFGICTLSAIPVRKEPHHESELVTELLFNDLYEVIEKNGDWLYVKMEYDSYEGWIRSLQHFEIQEDATKHWLQAIVMSSTIRLSCSIPKF